VLAHELQAAGDDHAAAFTRYQQLLAPYVARCQQLAIANLKLDDPTSLLARFVRTVGYRLLRIPFVAKQVARQALAVGRSFALPSY
jgi:2-polyprenyl-6-methoxyphenol hydroxylase-like FAD-dependent oxidoreductase